VWDLEDNLKLVDLGTEGGEFGGEPPSSQLELAVAKEKSGKTRECDGSRREGRDDEVGVVVGISGEGKGSSGDGEERGIEEVEREGGVSDDLSVKLIDLQGKSGRGSIHGEGSKIVGR